MKTRAALLFSLLFALSVPIFGQRYFESNTLGQPLREIPSYRAKEFAFVLEVREEEGLVVHRLFEGEKEITAVKRLYKENVLRREDVYDSGGQTESRTFNPMGEIEEEIAYEKGNVQERRVYVYSQGLVAEVLVYDETGAWKATYSYIRGGADRLRMVTKTDERKTGFSLYSMNRGRVFQEWHGDGASGDYFRFDGESRLARTERWDDGTISLKEEFFSAAEDLAAGRYSLTVNYKEGVKTEKYFDLSERLLLERTLREGVLVRMSSFAYDADGKVAVKQTRTPGLKEEWRYLYDGEGEVANETYLTGDSVRKVTVYTGEKSWYEEIYRNGVPFITAYFENNEKVREEFIGPPPAEGRGRTLR